MLDHLPRMRDARTLRQSSWDRSGRNCDTRCIAAGKATVIADIEGPGRITHIWIAQPGNFRNTLIRITWDDAPEPSVLCPIGDFFCLGHNIANSFENLFFTASTNRPLAFDGPTGFNCYIPMPFRKHALVEMVNESPADHMQWSYVDHEVYDAPEGDDIACFHAEFRRTNPFGGWGHQIQVNTPPADIANLERTAWENNYVILDTKGRGHYVGCNLSVTNFKGQWWGEGDDMIWVDGYHWPPDLHGTGSEDYLGHAWGMQKNAFLRCGTSLHESDTGGYQTSYVLHTDNPVHFRESIRVSIEVGHGNHLANEVSSVAYWYGDAPRAACDVPPAAQRRPVRRDNHGAWIRDADNECPGRPIELNDEMRENVERHALSTPPASGAATTPWSSPYVTEWSVSRVVDRPAGGVGAAEAVSLSDDLDWTPLSAGDTPPCFVRLPDEKRCADGLVYFAKRFRVAESGTWIFRIGHDGGARCFADGEPFFCDAALANPARPDRSTAELSLDAGEHEIVVALDTENGCGYGIFVCFALPPEARDGEAAFPEPA